MVMQSKLPKAAQAQAQLPQKPNRLLRQLHFGIR